MVKTVEEKIEELEKENSELQELFNAVLLDGRFSTVWDRFTANEIKVDAVEIKVGTLEREVGYLEETKRDFEEDFRNLERNIQEIKQSENK